MIADQAGDDNVGLGKTGLMGGRRKEFDMPFNQIEKDREDT